MTYMAIPVNKLFKLILPYRDLGATYLDERNKTNLIKRTVRRLEQLGYKVNVEPIQPATA